jgi:hypothetical protein
VIAEGGYIYMQRSLPQPAGSNPTPAVVAAPVAKPEAAVAEPVTRVMPAPTELLVRSDPPGARVAVNGRSYGSTPVTIPGLAAGSHKLVLTNGSSTVTQTVQLAESARLSVIVPFTSMATQPGWINVDLPIDAQVFESGQLLGVSQSERIMLAAGSHRLELVNQALGYRVTQVVSVAPGKVAGVSPPVPLGVMNLNALPWAEVFVDGERVGETPLGNVPIRIGQHEVLFTHPDLGTETRTVVVTATAPARVSVDLRK